MRKYANETLGLTTVQRKKEGGKPLQLSHIYRLLIDPFYAGFFYANDENEDKVRYEVNESIPRVITESQYWQAQAMLGRKGKSRPSKNKYSFVYSGKIVCGSCGGSVTAEKKNQLICSKCHQKFSYPGKINCPYCHTPIDKMEKQTYLHYIYYHCIKKKNPDCPERSIQESDIDKIAGNYYEQNLQISPDLRDWCLSNIKELDCGEQKNKYEQRLSWEREKVQKEHEYDELFKMKMKNLIDEDEFLKHKAELKTEIENINKILIGLGGSLNDKMDQIKKDFDLAVGIGEIFKNGTYEEKIETLSNLGSNLTLKGKNLDILSKEVIVKIINGLAAMKAQNKGFEPAKTALNKAKAPAFAGVSASGLRMLNEVRTYYLTH